MDLFEQHQSEQQLLSALARREPREMEEISLDQEVLVDFQHSNAV